MKAKPYTLLLHPLFILCLGLLLLNDLYFKYAWHNSFTGKLSDFAGLFVFAVFLLVFFHPQRKAVMIFCVLFFCWWKSPLSDGAILFVNEKISLPVHRVIDYTDLFAVVVLPLAWLIKPPLYKASHWRTIAIYGSGFIAFTSFCATSMIRHLSYSPYREHEIAFDETFRSPLPADEIRRRLDPAGLGYTTDSVKFYRIEERGDFYQRVRQPADSGVNWIPIANTADTTLFIKRDFPVFFILPYYVLNGDTLRHVEIRFFDTHKKRKPTGITIQTFQVSNQSVYESFWNNDQPRKYKKHFRALFKD